VTSLPCPQGSSSLAGAGFCVLFLALAFSRYGRIRLGTDDERPELSTPSWFAMMFAAGMGIGLVIFGASAPSSHLAAPPLGLAEPKTEEAAGLAMQYTIFHWGLHPGALYAVVGMALAYATFRKGRPDLLSSIILPSSPRRLRDGAPSTSSRSSSRCSVPPAGWGSAHYRSTAG